MLSSGVASSDAVAEAQFSPLDSATRVERLRSAVLAAHPDADCVLLVGGVDSRDDQTNNALINWLLCGTRGATAEFDDVVVLLHRGGTMLYTTPPAAYRVGRVVALWPHLSWHQLPLKHYEDQERFEEDKMNMFRRCVAEFGTVAMVTGDVSGPAVPSADLVRHVERWPLVQSYAVDPDGRRPFFTMAKAVRDASATARAVLCATDAFDIRVTTVTSAASVAAQVDATLAWAAQERTVATAADAPLAAQLRESAALFFEHALLGTDGSGPRADPPTAVVDRPFVRLCVGHPSGAARVARTFYVDPNGLHADALTAPVHAGENNEAPPRWVMARDAVAALRRTFAAVEQRGVPVASSGGAAASLRAAVEVELAKTSPRWAVQEVSAVGEHTVYVEAAVEGVAALSAVRYGETFVVAPKSAASGAELGVACVTAFVAPFSVIAGPLVGGPEGPKAALHRALLEAAETPPSRRTADAALGTFVAEFDSGDGCAARIDLGFGVDDSGDLDAARVEQAAWRQCKVYFYTKAFVVVHKRYGVVGPILIAGAGPALTLHDAPATTTPIVLRYARGGDAAPHFAVTVALRPSSFARREVSRDVLGAWKSQGLAVDTALPAVADFAPAFFDAAAAGAYDTKAQDEDPESEPARVAAAAASLGRRRCPGLDAVAAELLLPQRRHDEFAVAFAPLTGAPRRVCLVHLVAGPLGAGKHKVAAALLRSLDSEAAALRSAATSGAALPQLKLSNGTAVSVGSMSSRVVTKDWAAEEHHGQNPLRLSATQLTSQLITAARDVPATTAAAAGAAHAEVCVVVVPASTPLPLVFRAVADAAGSAAVQLASSTSVVNVDTFYENLSQAPPCHTNAGTWAALLPGFVDTVLVTETTRYSAAPRGRVERSVRRMLASLPAALGPSDGALLGAPHLDFVYSTTELAGRVVSEHRWAAASHLAAPQLQAARAAVLQAGGDAFSKHGCQRAQHFAPEHLEIRFDDMALIEPQLLDFMAHIADPPLGSPFEHTVCVKGELSVEGRSTELVAVAHRGYLNRLKPRSAVNTLRTVQTFHVFAFGPVDVPAMSRFLRRQVAFQGSLVAEAAAAADQARAEHRLARLGRLPLYSREAMSDTDVARAVRAVQGDVPLPDGWAHDGMAYHHRTEGTRTETRPDAEDLVALWLRQRNEAIAEHNASLPQHRQ